VSKENLHLSMGSLNNNEDNKNNWPGLIEMSDQGDDGSNLN
jgi:hypothetical protein